MNVCSPVAKKDVVLACADAALRTRLRESLSGLRWQVREASGGAEALTLLEQSPSEALLMDDWLPDLEASEFAEQIAEMYPSLEVLRLEAGPHTAVRSARRNELLHVLRELREFKAGDKTAWTASSVWLSGPKPSSVRSGGRQEENVSGEGPARGMVVPRVSAGTGRAPTVAPIPGLIGESESMLEIARLIRLVAPRNASVLIEGETGTGKEVVAAAVHRLSSRSSRSMTVLNCAAIPEGLLEAELFGHARGAFTGAVQARIGRIEAAHGGTLFLDEIGEMPSGLQAKLLRFLECGELQRVGDNDVLRVDVRVIAATHQDLEKRVADGSFRLDLYHRLAVFPIELPPLRERLCDLAALSTHLLKRLGAEGPAKRLSDGALQALSGHNWPGNVRELAHVLERATILAEDAVEIGAEHIRYRRRPRL